MFYLDYSDNGSVIIYFIIPKTSFFFMEMKRRKANAFDIVKYIVEFKLLNYSSQNLLNYRLDFRITLSYIYRTKYDACYLRAKALARLRDPARTA